MAATFGRGAMTNHWIDVQNADVVLIMGSNAVENHTVSFRYVLKAKERGGKLIHVDPRFTKTSTNADIYAPLRPGTDIAFIGGIINYALQNNLIQEEYVKEYTNASYLINPAYSFNDGIFSGYDAGKRAYSARDSWQYQVDDKGIPKRDMTLQDPNCVYQLMKKHYERYTPNKVSAITGCPVDVFQKVAELYTSTHKPDKVATIMYAMGATQHTVGVQNVRAYAILQMLMGNMGLAGGGINALRGESNVQGSCDHGLLWHTVTGYLAAPQYKDSNLEAYLSNNTPKTNDPKSINWLQHTPKYLISMLKAWFGANATKENDFCYDYLPKAHKPVPYMTIFDDMSKGQHKGAIYMGTNPVVGGPNANLIMKALERLDWMICADLWETDTSIFWKRKGINPANIKTEVFLLPMVSSVEKEGSVTNSGRWVQWRYKAQQGPGNSITDLDLIDELFIKIRALYEADVKAGKKVAFPDPILKADWNYRHSPNDHEADPHMVAKEINGYSIGSDGKKGKLLDSFMALKDDGTTACGTWICCGSYTEKGNQMARRGHKDVSNKIGLYPEWSWSWPVNRRIIYNRASVNLKGEPWDPKRAVVKWTGKKWTGDVPDGGATFGPSEKTPFIMNAEGVGRLFSRTLNDGPFPEHYEPFETTTRNLMNSHQLNPAVTVPDIAKAQIGTTARFPYVGTTYRVVEHWQAGAMTRNLPWLNELVPDMFCEISLSLAKSKGIKNGDKVKISSARGSIESYALVTDRIRPFLVDGKAVEMVGMVWHFGFGGASTGDSANTLTPFVGDPNSAIPGYKAFLVNIEKA